MLPPLRIPTAEQIPRPLHPLLELAYDLRVAWRPELSRIFSETDSRAWERAGGNPVQWLIELPHSRLSELAADSGFLDRVARLRLDLRDEDQCPSQLPAARELSQRGECVAYFSAEFGLTEILPIYAGGLGVLAGDNLKSASDLGVPVIGVGLFYREGYFLQSFSEAGEQQEEYSSIDVARLPLLVPETPDGTPPVVLVDFPGRSVCALIRAARVGRVTLLLLDCDFPANAEEDRAITRRLYGGNLEMRLAQEILLGVGGLKALNLLGLRPAIRHLNEGHAAFVTLEKIRQLVTEEHLSFPEARELAAAGNVFTTHTPVPAGIDLFPLDLIERHFAGLASEIGIGVEELLDLGREIPDQARSLFSMPALALRESFRSNAVSRLHARVSRELWKPAWPQLPAEDVPIEAITNGVHPATWRDPAIARLGLPGSGSATDRAGLWSVHELLRKRLIDACPGSLDPKALTIGFARRFATYKRATLLFRDVDRLARILNTPGKPVQFLFAGKAHPQDEAGKQFVRQIAEFSRRDDLRGKILLLPNYDMALARLLVSGCDAWLNNPERPLEASGTSGMKAAMNGVLNLSVPDGWWDEAPREETGFSIGAPRDHASEEDVAAALYDTLENGVIPLFFERNHEGWPEGWVEKMIGSIVILGRQFSSDRMVSEYLEKCYVPAARQVQKLRAAGRISGELPESRPEFAAGN